MLEPDMKTSVYYVHLSIHFELDSLTIDVIFNHVLFS